MKQFPVISTHHFKKTILQPRHKKQKRGKNWPILTNNDKNPAKSCNEWYILPDNWS